MLNYETEGLRKSCELNDRLVDDILAYNGHLLNREIAYPGHTFMGRRYADYFGALIAAWNYKGSRFYHAAELVQSAETLVQFLTAAQNLDGTMNSSNIASPPDTAFSICSLGRALNVLKNMKNREFDSISDGISQYMKNAGDMLLSGGIHTPNHRWVVSAALSYLFHIYKDDSYLRRIDQWLCEGIDQDEDGQFSERSAGIYSPVIVDCLISMGQLLNRPELLKPVRKHLDMIQFYFLPSGRIETIGSRRQDQYQEMPSFCYYPFYRFMAAHDQDRIYSGIARYLWEHRGKSEFSLLTYQEQGSEILSEFVPVHAAYNQYFSSSGLLRLKSGKEDLTLFAGTDPARTPYSGLSGNPLIMKFRKGETSSVSIKIDTGFFDMGYYKGSDPETTRSVLLKSSQQYTVPYYQPLKKEKLHPDGLYELADADGRFYSCLNFPDREKSEIRTLRLTIEVSKMDEGCTLRIQSEGSSGVPIAIELGFSSNTNISSFSGCRAISSNEIFFRSTEAWRGCEREPLFLNDGEGMFSTGKDELHFGPGIFEHDRIPAPYDTPFGPDPGNTDYVFLTLFTPVDYTLFLR